PDRDEARIERDPEGASPFDHVDRTSREREERTQRATGKLRDATPEASDGQHDERTAGAHEHVLDVSDRGEPCAAGVQLFTPDLSLRAKNGGTVPAHRPEAWRHRTAIR